MGMPRSNNTKQGMYLVNLFHHLKIIENHLKEHFSDVFWRIQRNFRNGQKYGPWTCCFFLISSKFSGILNVKFGWKMTKKIFKFHSINPHYSTNIPTPKNFEYSTHHYNISCSSHYSIPT